MLCSLLVQYLSFSPVHYSAVLLLSIILLSHFPNISSSWPLFCYSSYCPNISSSRPIFWCSPIKYSAGFQSDILFSSSPQSSNPRTVQHFAILLSNEAPSSCTIFFLFLLSTILQPTHCSTFCHPLVQWSAILMYNIFFVPPLHNLATHALFNILSSSCPIKRHLLVQYSFFSSSPII